MVPRLARLLWRPLRRPAGRRPGRAGVSCKRGRLCLDGGPAEQSRRRSFVDRDLGNSLAKKEGNDSQSTNINLNGSTPGANGWVRDTQPAWLPITTDEQISYHDFAGSNVSKYRFHVVAPNGYTVYFYNPSSNTFYESAVFQADLNTTNLLFVVKPSGEQGALAGKAADVTPGETNLRMALGSLPNGQSAGYLDFSPIKRLGGRDALGSFFLLYSVTIRLVS